MRREDDLKKRASVACLGSVPLLPAKKRTGRQKQRQILIDRRDGGSAFGESIRVIRTRIVRALEQKKTRRLLVTSAVQGEGKTTVAVNLAIALARQGRRVVLVDGDLRNPSVHTTLGMKKQGGIAEVLEGKLPLEDALTDYGNTGLSVLPGSAPRKDPISLLGGGGLAEMLDTLARTFEYVIVDAPPCGFLPDAAMLARQADGVISVVRQDYARVERILAAINHISETDTAYLGYVFNGVQAGIADGYGYGYGYRYGYGYGSRKKDGGHSAGNEM